MSESWRTCHGCGREVEMAQGQSLGEALHGWLIISCVKDKDSFERHSFCSLGCLREWTDTQMPEVPEVFRRSLDGQC